MAFSRASPTASVPVGSALEPAPGATGVETLHAGSIAATSITDAIADSRMASALEAVPPDVFRNVAHPSSQP